MDGNRGRRNKTDNPLLNWLIRMRIKIYSWIMASAYLLCGVVSLYLVPKFQDVLAGFNLPLPFLMKATCAVGTWGWLCLSAEVGIFVILKDLKFRSRYLNPFFTFLLVLWTALLTYDLNFLVPALCGCRL
jgi:hypothetical protein